MDVETDPNGGTPVPIAVSLWACRECLVPLYTSAAAAVHYGVYFRQPEPTAGCAHNLVPGPCYADIYSMDQRETDHSAGLCGRI